VDEARHVPRAQVLILEVFARQPMTTASHCGERAPRAFRYLAVFGVAMDLLMASVRLSRVPPFAWGTTATSEGCAVDGLGLAERGGGRWAPTGARAVATEGGVGAATGVVGGGAGEVEVEGVAGPAAAVVGLVAPATVGCAAAGGGAGVGDAVVAGARCASGVGPDPCRLATQRLPAMTPPTSASASVAPATAAHARRRRGFAGGGFDCVVAGTDVRSVAETTAGGTVTRELGGPLSGATGVVVARAAGGVGSLGIVPASLARSLNS
jgi:hypothetical protein